MIQNADKIITFGKLTNSADARSSTLAIVEKNGKKVNIKKPTFDYGTREMFSRSEYNLTEIGVIEDVESYVRQSFQKKTSLMFKEGEEFGGKDKQTIRYIKRRLEQIEYVSGQSFRQLLRETGYALFSRSNYFWVKVRKQSASGGRTIAGVQPVAAYYGMAPETVEIKKNKSGKIIRYRQRMPDGRYKDYFPKDIIHFYAYKKPGFAFGTPLIVPVKEDIRALRRIEENVELLIYQTLFPIFQYKVGTEQRPAGDIRLPDGTTISEIDYVRGQIYDMPSEGGIVTPERHEIKYIGAEGKALKAREYLDYFKSRVLSGLGISGVDIGEGDTANRATADNLSRSLVDSVKDYQNIIEDFINKKVIQELLLESTFNFDVLDEEHVVDFKFKEIDIEAQLKRNTNAQLLYNGNIIDINETRKVAGYEPITKEQEELMFVNRVDIKKAIEVAEATTTETDPTMNSVQNKNAPTNQHGTKTGPQKSRLDFYRKDNYIKNALKVIEAQISEANLTDKYTINESINELQKYLLKKYKDKGMQIATYNYQSNLDKKKEYELNEYLTLSLSEFMKKINGRIQRTIKTDKTDTTAKSILMQAELEAEHLDESFYDLFISYRVNA